jgi:hypothetical protein
MNSNSLHLAKKSPLHGKKDIFLHMFVHNL